MTYRADAVRKFVFSIFVFSFFLISKSAESADIQRIQLLEVPHRVADFKFHRFKTQWLLKQSDWQKFFKTHSRILGEEPKLPVNWKSESVLGIFWESIDGVVRIPTFLGTDSYEENGMKTLVLIFTLNTPCFGIITDSSPRQFMVVDHTLSSYDNIVVRTEKTKSVGCF